ncbi:actin-related protein Arp4p [Roridomyces roridus]|uniref:Actin-related protein Arp4p n=1 Tax=Roridomyces roridus TaxID=1738132 RepID=A0AAD7FRE2_9AGAR|nr:actin-related protein Arp4p [Roridomyces roridus]
MVNYGGDEVSALVIDIGTSSVRAGYAGDDTPKAVIPTSYGYHRTAPDADSAMQDVTEDPMNNPGTPKIAKMHMGQYGPTVWREGMEVANPMVEGLVNDFGPVAALMRHAVVDVMRCNPSDHPILVTEPAWNTPANRERMAEIMFEEFQVPAFYIANTGVLNAFAAGKGSALVIDVGHTMASVTPVVDGFVLRKGLAYSPLPQYVHAHARHLLVNPTPHRRGIDLFPHQLIANKLPVDAGAPPRFALREDRVPKTTQSWRAWSEAREVDEWIQSVAGVLETGWNDQAAASRPPKQYEFPTGYISYFGPERYSVGEQFFLHAPQMMSSNSHLPKTMTALISESLRACDPELRQVIMGNVVLTGGGSLFAGFGDRLSAELSRNFPHVKIHSPGNPVERRYGGWLGGSVLGSLGTFHQLWISKEEWAEHGKAIVGQRCK